MVKLKWLLISVVLLVFSFLLIQTYEKEIFGSDQLSSKNNNNNNIEVRRDKYNSRNFMWSGIFPLYGGFISEINERNVLDILDFSLSADQIDLLLHHANSNFYQLYTEYLNQDYASNQINSKDDKAINLTAYYRATLNINNNKMKDIIDKEYSLKVHNRYEFITSIHNVKLSNYSDARRSPHSLIQINYKKH
ncbi:hypothetical protein [Paenibacillus endoradicis]|uniref:hypothetical protein n=1 Tax=Paenibacillus endoradicis TaxID=2972487 RepID=UPI002159AD63|nr:hypothetical protein [Paenibacillus endoradicis]MCR8655954.1 hypothetical protein [Paenibacillus endoradicis]MCR8658280.1 hypothetical protein [Paenibacillus endoradicis]